MWGSETPLGKRLCRKGNTPGASAFCRVVDQSSLQATPCPHACVERANAMRQMRAVALIPALLSMSSFACNDDWTQGLLSAFSGDEEASRSISPSQYHQSFDEGTGGWMADVGRVPVLADGAAVCSSPWTADFWHAPPGGGYLHLLLWIHTNAALDEGMYSDYPGNSFADGGYSTNLTNAVVTVRLRGNVNLQGAQLCFWVQSELPSGVRANYVLSGQPISFSTDWSEQTVALAPDDAQWTCMYGRWDRLAESGSGWIPYECAPAGIAEVLADVNVDIVLVLWPLNIVPAEPLADPSLLHYLRAGFDYALDTGFLPSGTIEFDWLRIDYPQADAQRPDTRYPSHKSAD